MASGKIVPDVTNIIYLQVTGKLSCCREVMAMVEDDVLT